MHADIAKLKQDINYPQNLNAAKVFIVDDTLANLDVLRLYLEQDGHEVAFANNGEKALQLIPKWQPDLILLDILMTPIDGFAVCRQLKANPATAAVPIIFISALNEPEDLARGFREGGVDYLTKPLSRGEILKKVHTQLALRWYWRRCKRLQEDMMLCADHWLARQENAPAVLQVEGKGRIMAINQSAEALLGIAHNTLPTDNWGFLHPDDEDKMAHAWFESMQQQSSYHLQVRLHNRQPLNLHIVPLMSEQAENPRFITTLHPI